MNSKRSWCLKHVYAVIFMFVWVVVHSHTSGASECIEREREALLAIKKDLVDDYNRLSSWVSSGDCCKWEGVSCHTHTGHVLQLHLAAPEDEEFNYPWEDEDEEFYYQPLQGTLSPKLIELRNLTYLDLSDNFIEGDQDTPSFIGALTNLRYLDLSYNQFCGGQIIYKLGNLTHLEYLNLASYCYGDPPVKNLDWLPNHHSLRYLDLSGHNLSRVSDWLEIVNKLPNLTNLTLDGCDLPPPSLSYTNTTSSKSPLASVTLRYNPAMSSSSIFKWLFNYNTTLVYLDLSGNLITLIPDAAFRYMTSLAHLDLSRNQFCGGQIIYQLGNLTHLEYLNLAGLSCVDDASVQNLDWLPNHRSLRYLDLSYNNLSRVSDWAEIVNKLPNLTNLTLEECDLPPPSLSYTNTSSSSKSPLASVSLRDNPAMSSSSIFKWLFNYNTTLVYLDLSGNLITLIPDAAFRYMTSLSHLYLYRNELSGPIPEDVFRNMTSLVSLYLSSNHLTRIPDTAFRNTASLADLDLSSNHLTRIPDTAFRNMTSLASLYLSHNNLSGPIPPNVFGNMSLLRNLDLSSNLLDGVIPQSIGQMDSLESLDLSDNRLVGPMPDLTNLLSLRSLYLYGNHLSGRLPESIGNLSSLEILDLSDNRLLSGRIPESIGNLSSLEFLDLSDNRLSGRLPESIGNLSSLEWLDLSDNRLSGRIPESIGQLFNLEYLNLSVNSLQGLVSEVHFSNLSKLYALDLADNIGLDFDVHSDWIPPFQLYTLNLRSCKLGPDFPKWLATQKFCEVLDVSHAGISDVLPKNFWSLFGSFSAIDFSHNAIRGTFGNSTVELEGPTFNVGEVRFSSNQMEGQIPSFLLSLSYLDLSNNTFSEISSFLCSPNPEVKVLKYLDLSSNHVVEELPNCWTHLVNLQLLDLSNNEFSGTIRDSIGSLSGMETLKLRSNRLVGELPSSLMNCTNLTVIDLADNKFSSSVPEWIGVSFPSLIILMLQSNQFSGILPPQLCQLTRIQILDFSDNEISGTLPSCLDGLKALAQEGNSSRTIQHHLQYNDSASAPSSSYYEDEVTFIWKGSMSEYKNILGLVKRIDFSSNRLTGEIPSEVTHLVGLISLNLSRNNLTGHIPPDIGRLEWLDSLDFSRNQIGGKIPASLSQIDRLSMLDLSNNNLSGEIPTGPQLQTFDPSRFAGNHLCGLPLRNMCASEKTNEDDQEDTDQLITGGFYISLALGFVVGFWGVCGSLIFKRRWRYAYYRFLDAVNDWFYVEVTLIKRQFKDGCA